MRYKSQHQHVQAAVTKFKSDVQVVCEKVLATQESQNEMPPTPGQGMESLSKSRETTARLKKKVLLPLILMMRI